MNLKFDLPTAAPAPASHAAHGASSAPPNKSESHEKADHTGFSSALAHFLKPESAPAHEGAVAKPRGESHDHGSHDKSGQHADGASHVRKSASTAQQSSFASNHSRPVAKPVKPKAPQNTNSPANSAAQKSKTTAPVQQPTPEAQVEEQGGEAAVSASSDSTAQANDGDEDKKSDSSTSDETGSPIQPNTLLASSLLVPVQPVSYRPPQQGPSARQGGDGQDEGKDSGVESASPVSNSVPQTAAPIAPASPGALPVQGSLVSTVQGTAVAAGQARAVSAPPPVKVNGQKKDSTGTGVAIPDSPDSPPDASTADLLKSLSPTSAAKVESTDSTQPSSATATVVRAPKPDLKSTVADVPIAAVPAHAHSKEAPRRQVFAQEQSEAFGTTAATSSRQMSRSLEQNEIAARPEQVLPERPAVSAVAAAKSDSDPRSDASFSGVKADISLVGTQSVENVSSPLQVSESSQTGTHRNPTVEHLFNAITQEVSIMRQFNPSHLHVVLRPDASTEISLHLNMTEVGLQGSAQCQRGDFQLLNSHWGELQQTFDQQGIRLAPLGDSTAFSGSSSGHSGNHSGSSSYSQHEQRGKLLEQMIITETLPSQIRPAQTQPIDPSTRSQSSRLQIWA